MSAHVSTSSSLPDSPKARKLANYLREEVADTGGELYFKSKFIADDVDLSPKEIGALMAQLEGGVPDLTIEKWSYTSATTWRVEPR
ncbi:Uncharacterized protein AArcCO_0291 [Halalkaliarchaeum sp. AArc-CO]|uniref:DUF7123 family protein n=1 Tax=Halalkaliarchaeum sp. AArc-CO TaxID=2866381 RepID=UPI00217E7052|nr:hypothetical protein [Halalkaliarchaeum sp. AArc-CO]UWG49618.1 Uncharacterized protein AArcCO_0291 [Halalkaliarchaeum sp. AArc-CO]